MKSGVQLKGFNWKVGLTYIVINKHLTSNIGSLWKILPYRRKVGGNAPGMASKGMQGKGDDLVITSTQGSTLLLPYHIKEEKDDDNSTVNLRLSTVSFSAS